MWCAVPQSVRFYGHPSDHTSTVLVSKKSSEAFPEASENSMCGRRRSVIAFLADFQLLDGFREKLADQARSFYFARTRLLVFDAFFIHGRFLPATSYSINEPSDVPEDDADEEIPLDDSEAEESLPLSQEAQVVTLDVDGEVEVEDPTVLTPDDLDGGNEAQQVNLEEFILEDTDDDI